MVHSWVAGSSGTAIHHSDAFGVDRVNKRRGAGIRFNLRIARGLFFILSFLVLFTGLTLMHTRASGSEDGIPAVGEFVVTVDSGDTLWEIADVYKNPSIDTRAAVFALKKRNNLTTSELKIGQEIIFPVRILP